jgi:hypothetical protein
VRAGGRTLAVLKAAGVGRFADENWHWFVDRREHKVDVSIVVEVSCGDAPVEMRAGQRGPGTGVTFTKRPPRFSDKSGSWFRGALME